ncbi:hypothetical protein M0812_14686 [Anaeramoeba flamelloides]|uniref:Uncharacterized protein n=1 Tax=Anaeramoeba flamelloides TaxID=1746091 RepID=A0AAV7ZDT0_9EUKA|nr:hypothetical protein M0812_14686 [Anaeramoeba flamelloides]
MDKKSKVSFIVDPTQKTHRLGINKLAISPNGSLLATAGRDSTLNIFNIANSSFEQPEHVSHFNGHTDWVNCVTFCNNELVFSGSSDGTVKLWDSSNGKELCGTKNHLDYVSCLAYCSSTQQLVTGGFDHNLVLYKVNEQPRVNRKMISDQGQIKGNKDSLYSLDINQNGNLIISGGAEKVIRFWDLRQNKKLWKMVGHRDNIRDLKFLPDGNRILSAGSDGMLFLWDIRNKSFLWKKKISQKGGIWSINVNMLNEQIITSGKDRWIRQLSLKNCETKNIIKNDFSVTSICQDPNNKLWIADHSSNLKCIQLGLPLKANKPKPNNEIEIEIEINKKDEKGKELKITQKKEKEKTEKEEKNGKHMESEEQNGNEKENENENEKENEKEKEKEKEKENENENEKEKEKEKENEKKSEDKETEREKEAKRENEKEKEKETKERKRENNRKIIKVMVSGEPGIIEHQILNDNIRILIKKSDDTIYLYHICGSLLEEYGKCDFQEKLKEINPFIFIPKWFTVTAYTGSLMITLDVKNVFLANNFAENIPLLKNSKKGDVINIGKVLLDSLFQFWHKNRLKLKREKEKKMKLEMEKRKREREKKKEEEIEIKIKKKDEKGKESENKKEKGKAGKKEGGSANEGNNKIEKEENDNKKEKNKEKNKENKKTTKGKNGKEKEKKEKENEKKSEYKEKEKKTEKNEKEKEQEKKNEKKKNKEKGNAIDEKLIKPQDEKIRYEKTYFPIQPKTPLIFQTDQISLISTSKGKYIKSRGIRIFKYNYDELEGHEDDGIIPIWLEDFICNRTIPKTENNDKLPISIIPYDKKKSKKATRIKCHHLISIRRVLEDISKKFNLKLPNKDDQENSEAFKVEQYVELICKAGKNEVLLEPQWTLGTIQKFIWKSYKEMELCWRLKQEEKLKKK